MLIHLRAARLALLATSVVALVVLSPTAAHADSGSIDPGYGTNGSTSLPANTTFNDAVRLADGSTVAVGTSGTGTTVEIVAKFTAGGALDATFGTGGVVTIDVPGGTKDAAYGVSLRAGGGFVVAGTADSSGLTDTGAITKLTAAGIPDAAWGVGGTASLTVGGTGMTIVYGAHEDAAGTAVFVSRDTNFELFVGRVDATGDFTTGGVNWVSQLNLLVPDPVAANQVGGLLELAPGQYAVTASAQRPDNSSEIAAFHFPAAGDGVGSYDSATTGSRHTSSQPLFATGISPAPGGTAIATASTAAGGTTTGALLRITAAGVIDPTFGTAGLLALPVASEPWTATDAARTSDGRWYVSGNVGATRVRTQRLTAAFAPDPTFGDGNGAADRSYSAAGTRARSIVVDAQDRPVVFGQFGSAATSFRVDLLDYASTQLGDITFTPSFVQRLNLVTWKFPVTNSGPDATDVTVDVDYPTSIEDATLSSTDGGTTAPVADGSGATWKVPQLAAGATATLTLTGRPGNVGVITLGSSITSQGAVRVGAAPTAKSISVLVYGAATPRDDVIVGTPQRDVIDALAGDDKVTALAGNDRILGSEGNDVLDLGPGNDVGLGGDGVDTIVAGSGTDAVAGGPGNDVIATGTGSDTASGNEGDDRIRGEAGNDRLHGNDGSDIIDGAVGNDRLYGDDGNDELDGGAGNDIVFGGAGVDRLVGSTGDDYLIGLTGNDLLIGGPGRDRVDGDGGNDKLYGNAGSDWLNGKTGNDVAYGSIGNDWLRGFTGNDLLVGEAGNDLLNGGLGADRLYGGVGNDIFRADDGKAGDYVNCGTGWDLVYANPGDVVTRDCEFVKYDVFAVAMP